MRGKRSGAREQKLEREERPRDGRNGGCDLVSSK